MTSVVVGGPGLVAVGITESRGDWDAVVWWSVDGLKWNRVPHDEAVFGGPDSPGMGSVVAGGPGLVAVGFTESRADAVVWWSVDGLTWNRVPHDEAVFGGPGTQRMTSVVVGGPGLVAVGFDELRGDWDAVVWWSVDGLKWNRVPHDEAVFGGPGFQLVSSVVVGGPGLVAVGDDGSGGDLDAAVWVAVPSEASVPEPSTTPTTEAVTEVPEPGPLGAVVVAAGGDIQIRSLQAISGDVAFLGVPNQRGIELAVADYGDIKGHSVSIGTPLDDLCNTEGGAAAGQRIASDDRVIGVVGTSCSGAARGASPPISRAGMVMISPSNTSPSLTSDLMGNAGENYNPGYYRTAHNDVFQGVAVAAFVFHRLGKSKAAAIYDGNPYSYGVATAFKNAFEALGGTIVAFTAVDPGDTDVTGVLTQVARAGPEVLYFPIFMPEGGFIVQQAKSVAGFENVTMIASDGLLVDNFMELKETEGMYFSGPNLDYGNNESEIGTTAASFLAAYRAEYGEAPSAAFWAHSYDATVLLLSAIDAVAIELVDGSLFIDRQALRDELSSTNNFAGITGTLSCDEFGDCGAQRILISLHLDSADVEAGKSNIVYEFSRND
jgi:branched-chain amino acid transport system substrate-binding protein